MNCLDFAHVSVNRQAVGKNDKNTMHIPGTKVQWFYNHFSFGNLVCFLVATDSSKQCGVSRQKEMYHISGKKSHYMKSMYFCVWNMVWTILCSLHGFQTFLYMVYPVSVFLCWCGYRTCARWKCHQESPQDLRSLLCMKKCFIYLLVLLRVNFGRSPTIRCHQPEQLNDCVWVAPNKANIPGYQF